jgi:hypothetical protein
MNLITKFGFAALITASVSSVSVAQMYLGVHSGYNVSTSNSVLGTSTTGGSGTSNTVENIYGTNGGSSNFGLNAGYMFSEHFGFDLGATYVIGASQVISKSTDANTSTLTPVGTLPSKTTETRTVSGSQLRVIPSLVVSAGGEGIRPYARFGVVIPVSGATIVDVNNVTTIDVAAIGKPVTTTVVKSKSEGQFALGFNTAVGMNIGLNSKMTLFAELSLTTLSIKAKSAVYTDYTSTTVSAASTTTKNLSDLKTSASQTNFVDKLDASSNNAAYNPTVYGATLPLTRVSGFDDSKPTDELAPTANYNNIGLNIGIRYKF